ncbi:unnamed protein product [Prorocentrum cordatum]|uniref:Uncharacterized protein n=1 Tax=Prorocentrum cordatum TaxID=2364126 RepID=A0ABN9PSU2_9DINO|nr:unnamed protein product [Polarella glacialis]
MHSGFQASIKELSAFVAYEADAARLDGATPEAFRAAWGRLPPEGQAAWVPRQPRRKLAMGKKWALLLSRSTADQHEAWEALDILFSVRRPWQVCADALEEQPGTSSEIESDSEAEPEALHSGTLAGRAQRPLRPTRGGTLPFRKRCVFWTTSEALKHPPPPSLSSPFLAHRSPRGGRACSHGLWV